jgi:HIRAN domain-containing protein
VLGGTQALEVVGESFYQNALWLAVGGNAHAYVRHPTTARLFPEPDNAHDANAISVWIEDRQVGHLCRDDAAAYRPGLLNLERIHGAPIGLRGTVVGGGPSPRGGEKYLGVWLAHDPGEFGVEVIQTVPYGQMRTGLTEAMASDLEDDSYDLSWWQEIPEDQIEAIAYLRGILVNDPDPIDRHYMFAELEWRLYRQRDELIEDYDAICIQHDAEMGGIRAAMMAKWDRVPVLDTYRQATIRWYKAKDYERAAWWAERGLVVYGDACARPEAVDDLSKRAEASRAKLL